MYIDCYICNLVAVIIILLSYFAQVQAESELIRCVKNEIQIWNIPPREPCRPMCDFLDKVKARTTASVVNTCVRSSADQEEYKSLRNKVIAGIIRCKILCW